MAEKVNILQFMVIRPANLPAPASIRRSYIRDDSLQEAGYVDADLFSEASESEIGKLVYTNVFCSDVLLPEHTVDTNLASTGSLLQARTGAILGALIQTLTYYDAPCPNPPGTGGRVVESLPDRSFVISGTRIYLIPDRLQDVSAPLVSALPEVLAAARAAAVVKEPPGPLDKVALAEAVRNVLGVKALETVVFKGGSRTGDFTDTKRKLFDTLYLLYILRRRLSLRLEAIIDGLRALHILEALAIDEALDRLRQQGQARPSDLPLLEALTTAFPSLRGWNFGPLPSDLPLIASAADLELYLSAAPVVHPLFARFHYFRQPFNAIRPLGIGDLKVVKQWLSKYKAGEIAHIDNVLLGETKTRV